MNQDKQRIEFWMKKRNLTAAQANMGRMMIEAGYGYAAATRNIRYLESDGREYALARRCYVKLLGGNVHGAVGVRGRSWTRSKDEREPTVSQEEITETEVVKNNELSVEDYVLELLGSSLTREAKIFFFASLVSNLDTSDDND